MSLRAFVPGHVTGFFSAHPHEDPTIAGSRGAGLALSDGVRVTVDLADETTILLNDQRGSMAAVKGVLDRLGVTARVEAETPLPVSAGFGVSGASALGTALATNAAMDGGYTENELVTVAHAAEVKAGTGLGDVVGQARGGIPIRLEPGAPPRGQFDGLPAHSRVEYVTFGGLDTAAIIGGDTDQLSRAGEKALASLLERPTLDRFMTASWTFAREAGLVTERVRSTVEDVHQNGGKASMAMLGETVFALDDGLSSAGYDPATCHIANGARIE